MVLGTQSHARVLAKLLYPWFERTCFCLVALLMQCEFPLYRTRSSPPFVAVILVKERKLSKPDEFFFPVILV